MKIRAKDEVDAVIESIANYPERWARITWGAMCAQYFPDGKIGILGATVSVWMDTLPILCTNFYGRGGSKYTIPSFNWWQKFRLWNACRRIPEQFPYDRGLPSEGLHRAVDIQE